MSIGMDRDKSLERNLGSDFDRDLDRDLDTTFGGGLGEGRAAGERRKKIASVPPRGRSPTESLKNYWGWCGGGRAGGR